MSVDRFFLQDSRPVLHPEGYYVRYSAYEELESQNKVLGDLVHKRGNEIASLKHELKKKENA